MAWKVVATNVSLSNQQSKTTALLPDRLTPGKITVALKASGTSPAVKVEVLGGNPVAGGSPVKIYDSTGADKSVIVADTSAIATPGETVLVVFDMSHSSGIAFRATGLAGNGADTQVSLQVDVN